MRKGTKTAVKEAGISIEEYAARRERLMRAMGGAVGVVFAGEASPSLHGKWRAESMFRYLTGVEDEPGAALLLDPKAEDALKRSVLFLKPRNPDMERWDGARAEIGGELRARTGFRTVMRTLGLARLLTAAVRRSKKAACLHPLAGYESPVSMDLQVLRKVAERVPGVLIVDETDTLQRQRAVKSGAELGLMRRAVAATAVGFARAVEKIGPGVGEGEVQRALEEGFREGGGQGTAFGSIVGSGFNGTVLHYIANNGVMQSGDLVVMDAGAEYGGYAADVTRTYPVSGRFSVEQRELYETVLRAQEAAIRAARPGASLSELDGAARSVLERAGLGDAFIHGIGHHLGLEVHDVMPDGKLSAGMVITIEPGVYLPDRRVGIRIEDDVLITSKGNEVLSKAIPKSIAQIEGFMKGGRGVAVRARAARRG